MSLFQLKIEKHRLLCAITCILSVTGDVFVTKSELTTIIYPPLRWRLDCKDVRDVKQNEQTSCEIFKKKKTSNQALYLKVQ